MKPAAWKYWHWYLQYSLWRWRRRRALRRQLPPTQEEENIRLLYWDTAWQGVLTAGTGTFLPVYLARIQASSFFISALTALPALVGVLFSLPASMYVERHRDHVYLTTLFRFFFRLTYVLVAFVPFLALGLQPWLIVLIWTIQAFPAAVVVPAWTSVVGAIVPPARRPAVNGGRWALLSVVTAVCVAGFGKLLDLRAIPFPWNYQFVFFISAIAGFVSLGYFSRIKMPQTQPVIPPARRSLRERLSELIQPMLQSPDFMKYNWATFFVRLGAALPVALFSIFWVRELHASDTIIGLRTTIAQASLVAGYFLFGRLAARRGHREVLILSSVGVALYPIATAFIHQDWWLLPVAVLWGFFTGGVDISFFEGLLETTPPDKRASFAALNAAFANLAVFAGPLLGSALAEWLGIRVTLGIAGGISILGAYLCWRLGVGARRRAH